MKHVNARPNLVRSGHHYSLFFCWLCLAGCLLLGRPALAQSTDFTGKKVTYQHPDLDRSFRAFEVYQLDVDALYRALEGQDHLQFSLTLGEEHRWEISLSYHDLRGPDYQEVALTERGQEVLPARRAITYRGFLNDKSVSEVRLNSDAGFLSALVIQDGERLFMENLSGLIEGAPGDYLLVYRAEDFRFDGTMECSVSEIAGRRSEIAPGLEKAAGSCQAVELVTAATFDMVSRYGTIAAVNNRIQCVTNLMEPFYHFAMIDFVIVQQFVPASAGADPFTASADGCDLLNSLQAWAAGGGITTHDLGQLWTARDIFRCGDPTGTSLIGRAMSIGNICENDRYNVCEDFTNNLGCLAILSAHEIGHNFDAVHGDAGAAPNNIMSAFLDCGATAFSAANRANIDNHVASRVCLGNCGTPSNDICGKATLLGCGDKFSGATIDATAAGAPLGCGNGGPTHEGVWFQFVGTGDIVTVSTTNSAFDTKLHLYSGICGALSCLDGDDDSGPGLTSELTFCSSPGVNYYVYLDGYAGATGFYSIDISCTPDITAPTLVCPANQSDVLNAACSFIMPDYRGLASASDNCDPTPTLTQTPAPGSTLFSSSWVTISATDDAGNASFCQFFLTLTDDTPPTIACPGSFTRPNDPGLCSATFDLPAAAAADNCGVTSLLGRFRTVNEFDVPLSPWSVFSVTPGGTFALGRYEVEWRATDGSFNTSSCSYFFDVVDVEPPVAACFDTTIVFNGEEGIAMVPDLVWDEANSSDNCDKLFFIGAAPDTIFCDELGDTVSVLVLIADNSGNQSFCAATVEVLGLPCGWSFHEDGINCEEGNSAAYDVETEAFTLEATHCYLDRNLYEDQAGFISYELCGDGEIIARVDSVEGIGWAGIAMRESADSSAKKVELTILNEEVEGGSSPGINNNNIVRYEVRTETDSAAVAHHFPRPSATWLRLVREGDEFYGYTSHNGTDWYPIWVETVVDMNDCIEVGLIAYSYMTSETIVGHFSHVTVTNTELVEVAAPEMNAAPALPTAPLAASIRVFPNPASGQLTVSWSSDGLTERAEAVTEIQLYNSYGQLAHRRRIDGAGEGTQQLDVSNLTPGAYYLRILIDGRPAGHQKISIVR